MAITYNEIEILNFIKEIENSSDYYLKKAHSILEQLMQDRKDWKEEEQRVYVYLDDAYSSMASAQEQITDVKRILKL